MKSGVLYSNAAALDGIIDRIEEELGEKATVVATGGLAKKIVPHCKREIILDEELLLRGLLIIYEKISKNVYAFISKQFIRQKLMNCFVCSNLWNCYKYIILEDCYKRQK